MVIWDSRKSHETNYNGHLWFFGPNDPYLKDRDSLNLLLSERNDDQIVLNNKNIVVKIKADDLEFCNSTILLFYGEDSLENLREWHDFVKLNNKIGKDVTKKLNESIRFCFSV
jgi:hypothetical protein